MRRGIRVNAVLLKQFVVHCDTLHEELDPLDAEVLGYLCVNCLEGLSVASAGICRYTDSQQDDGSAGSLGLTDNGPEIFLDTGRRKTTQTIISAEFQYDQVRLERIEGIVNPRRTAFGGLTANAGVHYAMFVPLLCKPVLQQSGPGLVNVYTKSGAQAVAEDQHGRWFRRLYTGGQK